MKIRFLNSRMRRHGVIISRKLRNVNVAVLPQNYVTSLFRVHLVHHFTTKLLECKYRDTESGILGQFNHF